jgi:hypothetical protein
MPLEPALQLAHWRSLHCCGMLVMLQVKMSSQMRSPTGQLLVLLPLLVLALCLNGQGVKGEPPSSC